MLFLRLGPRFLFIRTMDIPAVKFFLIHALGGKSVSFHGGNDEASEDSTLCFLTAPGKVSTSIEDADEIILVNEVSSFCLASIINSHVEELIDRVDMGPASLVMRVAGDEKKIIQRLQEEYQAETVDWEEGIRKGERANTLLGLTKKPINSILSENDFIHPNLLLPHPVTIIQKRLRIEGLRFITQSLESGQWYELRINIYDSKGRYQENYDRLVYILSKLEIGMILGEAWTKDHALALLSVLAFQVRLFTYYTPHEVKKLLMALEFNLAGERLVDFDLYYRNRKISWVDIDKRRGRRNKATECIRLRQELYEKMEQRDIALLEAMETGLNEG
ncbi:hypothetical protein [Alkaliphilus crotonatoxidans]